MSDIERFFPIWVDGVMMPANNGKYVRYDDHRAEVERLTVERDEAQAEVKRLKEQVAALTVAVEQADEMKAHAEAAAAAEEAETDRVMAERHAAQAEVERLTQNLDAWKKDCQELEQKRNRALDLGEELNRELEGQKAANQRLLRECAEDIASAKAREEAATTELNEAREKLAQVQVQYDEFAKVTAKVIEQHQRERDHARQQVYRLQQAGAGRPTDPSAQNLDMANGQAILDCSRPDDETIWREAFMSQLHDRYWAASEVADVALAEYRKRWSR